ncbi:hypothetical protein SAMN02910413_1684 [Pseudobutyrivibrio sp. C4]|uniref:hypothetical protein n=1 Tax=Pseudobutyrivibrio sp. C4 TaxID=1520803 RepID=UPI0008D841CC|nr:hypothetical protein [Pseudobutyrivibrio sp. C4]SET05914.1 hypothetical protein SAMN02910413_1684 [Pseudobutyrivibrio sp. C4]
MEFKTFVRAVLDTHFPGTKDEIIESAAKAICNYTGQPIIKNEGKTIQFSKPKFKDEEEIKVGDICTYKNYAEKFIITKIDEGKFFEGIYFNGTIISDGTISLIEKVGHCDELQQLLDKMKGEN